MNRRCTCAGDPDRICVWCHRRIDLAEFPEPDDGAWMAIQDRYERWLDVTS